VVLIAGVPMWNLSIISMQARISIILSKYQRYSKELLKWRYKQKGKKLEVNYMRIQKYMSYLIKLIVF